MQSPRASTRILYIQRALGALALLLSLLACAPPMVERDGHRVFNPRYLSLLDAPWRAAWHRPDEVLAALAIREGAVVADIGAGSGYFMERLSRRVGPTGVVYATDVQTEMIDALARRVTERELENVRVVRADFDDPTLPADCCDLVFLSSVYKEIDDRIAYAKKLAPLLRSGGRLAILEFRPEAHGFGPPREERLAPEQVQAELATAGFELVTRHDSLPQEYLLVFASQRENASTGDPGALRKETRPTTEQAPPPLGEDMQ